MSEPEDPEAERRRVQDFRRHLRALMLSLTFTGGALFGLLGASLGLPGVWWAPVTLVATGVFWLMTRSRR